MMRLSVSIRQNPHESAVSKMTEKDLIKQLNELGNIKPNNKWVVSARQNLINHIESTDKTRNIALSDVLFRKVPNFSFALTSGVFALLLILSIGLFPIDSIEFGAGITQTDLSFSNSGNDLIIQIGTNAQNSYFLNSFS